MPKAPPPMPPLVVLYGSAGGCAESIAQRIHDEASAHGFASTLDEMNRYYKTIEAEFAVHPLVVLVASTTGHGDPPDNAGRFWRKLKKGSLPKDLLSGMEFAVLGLGDTNYDEFCHFGKQLDKRFAQLGARRVIDLGCADDAVGLDAVVEPWITNLWATLSTAASAAAPSAAAAKTAVTSSRRAPLVKGGVWSPPARVGPAVPAAPVAAAAPNLAVLYASQGGCAQSIAQRIYDESTARGFTAKISELNAYHNTIEAEFAAHTLVVIVASTTGHGDPPDNGGRFWRKLKKGALDTMLLRSMEFAVLGLGDTNYDEFCHFAKRLDKRLAQLGGRRVVDLGCADDAVGLDTVVEPWITKLWATLVSPIAADAAVAAVPAASASAAPGPAPAAKALNAPSGSGMSMLDKLRKRKTTSASTPQVTLSATPPSASPSLATAVPIVARAKTPLVVLYGSAGGCAQSIAQRIHNEASAHGFASSLDEMNRYYKTIEAEFAVHPLVVLVASTTGHGDPPDNAGRFWRKLKKKALPTDLLSGMEFAVLGLGDTNYDEFCHFGKQLDKRFAQLGARRVIDLGCADDAVGLDAVVEPWIKKLWAAFAAPKKEAPVVKGAAAAAAAAAAAPSVSSAPAAAPTVAAAAPLAKTPTTSVPSGSGMSLLEKLRSRKQKKAASKAKAKAAPSATTVAAAPPSASLHATAVPATAPTTAAPAAPHSSRVIKFPRSFDAIVDDSSVDAVRAAIPDKLPRYTPCAFALQPCARPTSPLPDAAATPAAAARDADGDEIVPGSGQDAPYLATISRAECLTADGSSHRVIQLDLDVGPMIWQPGDAIGVVCKNRSTPVAKLLERLDLIERADAPVRVVAAAIASSKASTRRGKSSRGVVARLPAVFTPREALEQYCDLHTLPKKAFLRALAEHCTALRCSAREQERDRNRLLLLSGNSKSSRAFFTSVVEAQRLSLIELLEMFPSCQPPLELLLASLPPLQPRFYSIASSPLRGGGGVVELDTYDNDVEGAGSSSSTGGSSGSGLLTIVLSVVDYTVDVGDGLHLRRSGVCTSWLDQLTVMQKTGGSFGGHGGKDKDVISEIAIFLAPTRDFLLPACKQTPLIMVGPGTGVAPFVGFLQHIECCAQLEQKLRSAVCSGFWRGGVEVSCLVDDDEHIQRQIEFLHLRGRARPKKAKAASKSIVGTAAAAPSSAAALVAPAAPCVESKVVGSDGLRECFACLRCRCV